MGRQPPGPPRLEVGRLAWALARRPGLWATAATSLLALAPRGWWRRWPPLPRPDPGWLGFRLECATGHADATVEVRDLVAWLEWCKGRRGLAR